MADSRVKSGTMELGEDIGTLLVKLAAIERAREQLAPHTAMD
jgi:hypothetical protein